ncbi:MAG: HpcH/HpaI aldolase family protein [Acidobacteriota bacterium]
MKQNKTKAKLKAGETVLGCFVRYPDAALIEVLGYYGWDFLVFDAEHGTIEARHCENMVRAAELQDVTPIVRVTTNQAPVILRLMDTGAQGLHIPMINSLPDAQAAVASVKYHPCGGRGLAGVRASDYGQAGSYADYCATANAETLIAAHIETGKAVDHLPDIVKVQDLDVIFIGPTDLSHSLGFPGQVQHPEVQKTMDRIAEIVAGSDKFLGIMVGDAQAAREWHKRGARYITVAFESVLGPACRSYLEAARPTI